MSLLLPHIGLHVALTSSHVLILIFAVEDPLPTRGLVVLRRSESWVLRCTPGETHLWQAHLLEIPLHICDKTAILGGGGRKLCA